MKRIFLILMICLAIGGINVNKIKGIRVAGLSADGNKRFDRIENKLNEVIDNVLGITPISMAAEKTLPADDQYTYLAYTPTGEMSSGQGTVQDEDGESIIIPPETKVSGTVATHIVARGFYKNLQLDIVTAEHYHRRIQADYLGLTTSDGETIALQDFDETCDIATAGPIVNGRDQAGAFTINSWVYFYAIYNPYTKTVGSLASASATSPTKPTGFTGLKYVGPAWVDNNGYIDTFAATQRDNMVWYGLVVFQDHSYSGSDWDEENIHQNVPVTARSVWGYFGTSTNPSSPRGMSVASNDAGLHSVSATVDNGAVVYSPRSGIHFHIPILVEQRLFWQASTTNAYFYLSTHGFVDNN